MEEFLNSFFIKEKKLFKNKITVVISGNNLIISAPNKIVANEMAMRIGELTMIFKKKNLLFDRVIIK